MSAEVSAIPADATVELHRFWSEHPDLRQACVERYGYDPVNQPLAYWRHGLAEPEHTDILASVERAGGVFSLADVKRWEREELADAAVEKAGIPAWAHYREATVAGKDCGTCDFYDDGRCAMFDNTPVRTDFTCDKWAGRIDKAHDPQHTATDHKSSQAASNWTQDDLDIVGGMVDRLEPMYVGKSADAKAAGIAVRAANTGRVLMIQRSNADAKDKAAGKWEFPGGNLNDGEHPLDGARREWQEEMGSRLPKGQHIGQWRSGVYHGFVHEVPTEGSIKLNLDPADRRVLNPDDPDGDDVEVAAWWDPEDMKRSPAIRDELRAARPWTKVAKGQARQATLHLRVHGVSNAPGGMRVYRMATRDGHYVGRTLPSRVRARKGDVLKVQTGDFLQDVQGDMRWVNPNVVSHYSDAPHSWRELSALAGGEIAKDGAPGSAGDLPPAGDLGASSAMPSMPTLDAVGSGLGPTIAGVHVNVPLPDISVSYVGEKKRRKRKKTDDGPVLRGEFLPVQKDGQWKQLVYGVVLEPNVMDSQDDFMLPHHVEKAAHEYMKRIVRGNASVMKLQHREQGFKKTQPSIVPVESFIAPVDFPLDSHELVKKGSWVIAAHVEDDALWQDFLDRKYTGFSIGGTGIRRSVSQGNYAPEVPDGYMPQEPADWSQPLPHPGYFTAVL